MDNMKYLQPFLQGCKAGVIKCTPSDILQYWKIVEDVMADYAGTRLTWDLSKKILDHTTNVVNIFDGSTQVEESEILLVMFENILIDFLGKNTDAVIDFIQTSDLASVMMAMYVYTDAYDQVDDTIISLRTLDKYKTVSFIIKTS